MAATFKEFRAEVSERNVSRPNLYEVVISPPPGLRTTDSSSLKLINLFCSHAQSPQSMIQTDNNYIEAGARRKYAFNHDTSNLVLHFYADQDNKIKFFFDSWMKLITPRNRKFAWPEAYTSHSITVYILDLQGERVYKYAYMNCFPSQVFGAEVGHAMHGQPSQIGVEFVFERFDEGVIDRGEFIGAETIAPAGQVLLNPVKKTGTSDNLEVNQKIIEPSIQDDTVLNYTPIL